MHVLSTLIPALGLFAHLGAARYTLADDYTKSFFDKFSFFTVREVLHLQGNVVLTSNFLGRRPDQWLRQLCGPTNCEQRGLD